MTDTRTVERIRNLVANKAKFTLENGRGETYHSKRPVLYSHTKYPRSSVLAGQPCRSYIEEWATWEEAERDVVQIKAEVRGFKARSLKDNSTFIPTDTLCDRAGLPHDEDY